MRTPWLLVLTSTCLVACITLGGGTHAGFLDDVLIEAFSVPLGLVVIWTMLDRPWSEHGRWPIACLAFTLLLLALPLAQLIPYPPGMMSRSTIPIAQTFAVMGQPVPWLPIAVWPEAAMLAWLSMIPPIALFWGVAMMGFVERRALSIVLLVLGGASVFLGLLQIAQGPQSPLRFYEFTNLSEAVGFFANRNHFSALLYCELVMASAWTLSVAGEFMRHPEGKGRHSAALVGAAVLFSFLVMLMAAQGMARSRAGLLLTLAALAGALLMSVGLPRATNGLTPRRLIGVAGAVAGLFIVQFALFRVFDRFAYESLAADARVVFSRNTMSAAWAFMPFGSGLGSFVRVYDVFETPADSLAGTFANHAHNDWLEVWLETGVAGIVLACAFMIWYVTSVVAAWRRRLPAAQPIDRLLAMAATLIIALLLAHSLVDYPLRTEALLAVFAFAAALLVEPPVASAGSGNWAMSFRLPLSNAWIGSALGQMRQEKRQSSRGRSRDRGQAQVPIQETERAIQSHGEQRWGQDVSWPDPWLKANEPNKTRFEPATTEELAETPKSSAHVTVKKPQ